EAEGQNVFSVEYVRRLGLRFLADRDEPVSRAGVRMSLNSPRIFERGARMATPRRISTFSWIRGLQAAVPILLLPSLAVAQSWREAGFLSRAGQCAIYAKNQMWIFGGKEGSTLRGDVWALSLPGLGPSRWYV